MQQLWNVMRAPRWVAVLALAGALAGAGTLAATEGAAAEGTTAPAAPAGEVSGLWLFLDPQTGRPAEPTQEQLAAIRQQVSNLINESTAGLTTVTHPGGYKTMDLQGRFQSVSILTLTPANAPGTAQMTCAESVDEAVAALVGRPVPTQDGLETE